MLTKKRVLLLIGLAAFVRYRFRFSRGLLHVLHELLTKAVAAGLYRPNPNQFFKNVDDKHPPTTRLLAFAKLMSLLPGPKDEFRAIKGTLHDWYEVQAYRPVFSSPEDKLRVKRVEGIKCGWISSPKVTNPKGVLVYIHGGGYVSGHIEAYSSFCLNMCEKCNCEAFLIEYRKVPSVTIAEASDDIVRCYRSLLDSGYKAENIVFAGDSAGGGHTLGALQNIIRNNLPVPSAGVLISPYCDLTHSHEAMDDHHHDIFFKGRGFFDVIRDEAERVSKTDIKESGLHSFLHGSFEGLPPLYICVGESERLVGDSYRVIERAIMNNIKIETEVHHYGHHNYPLLADIWQLEDYQHGLANLCNFVKNHMGSGAKVQSII